ncbi:hypothetical protein EV356DRAFT_514659 [Viridothelium virens]|uniref:Zn(2)-C6 fungal-type domain-containing protein n=1 Tax=Viridothelium virens TaxID=1048519 RepID=A0A6A6HAI2_VIRVR|nr:hypothetical protein EV356DRAFT_514659 [Viridothelium virens]
MTLPHEEPKKHRRYCTKVKTGCRTCKIRRVKCDEAHPACRRCTSTGRKCDGYAIQEKPNQTIIPTKSLCLDRTGTSLTKILGTTAESRSLEFYFERAAPKISGLLGNNFWFRIVYQIGYSEPAVRHALIAIGYLFEKQGHDPPSKYHHLSIYTDDKFLLNQYNRAIGCLVTRMSNKSNPVDISLVTSVLFVCLESLMQRPWGCLAHYKSGLELLLNMRAKQAIAPGPATQAEENPDRSMSSKSKLASKALDADLVEETLVPLFTRLNLTALLHGASEPHISSIDTTTFKPLPVMFASFEEGSSLLLDIINHSLRYVQLATVKRYEQTLTQDDFAVHSYLLLCLDRWLKLLNKWEHITGRRYNKDPQLCTLRIFHMCMWIWLSCCNDPLEMEFDDHVSDFCQVLSLADVLVNSSSAPKSPTELDFTYDMEYVPPVYFAAVKCRDPMVRRRAISLLDARRRREGLWHSERCSAVAKRIMAIEEAGLCGSLTRRFPPAKYRITDAVMAETGPSFRTTLFTLPHALGTTRYQWDEMVHLVP